MHNHSRPADYYRVLSLRTLGNFLILSALFMIAKTFYQPAKEELRYFINRRFNKQYIVESPETRFRLKLGHEQPKGGLARLLNIKPIEALIPKDPNFSIIIPKIGANAPVISSVDPADEKIYLSALQKGVAHALGTAFPGEGGHVFLFAHSTDYIWNVGYYNAVFYLLYKLEKGDDVNLFYKGQRYVYQVVDKVIVDPSQVEYLTRKTNREFLTLQTCWPPGTTLKRLLIFAVRKIE